MRHVLLSLSSESSNGPCIPPWSVFCCPLTTEEPIPSKISLKYYTVPPTTKNITLCLLQQMISGFILRSDKQFHQHSWHDKYIVRIYFCEQSRLNFSQFRSQLKTRWRLWGSQTMYTWYFNGVFPPPQKKLVVKRQKIVFSLLVLTISSPDWCRR